jgi:hypothetical protein
LTAFEEQKLELRLAEHEEEFRKWAAKTPMWAYVYDSYSRGDHPGEKPPYPEEPKPLCDGCRLSRLEFEETMHRRRTSLPFWERCSHALLDLSQRPGCVIMATVAIVSVWMWLR